MANEFDFNALMGNPMFQMGLGLYGGARPGNRGVLDAFQMMQNAQMAQQRQKLLEQQAEQYAGQVAAQKRKVELEAKQAEQWGNLMQQLPQILGGGMSGAASMPSPAPMEPQRGRGAEPSKGVGFSQFDDFVARVEGGLVPNDGGKGPSNFGINQTANPDVDVTKLTPEQAQQIRKTRYWDTIQGDQIQQVYGPATAAVAYDAAINQGPAFAQRIVEQSGGDPKTMLALRRRHYAELAKRPQYAQYAQGWENRLKQLEAEIGGTSPAPAPVQNVAQTPQQGGMDPYRQLQMLGAIMKGQTGDIPGAISGLAGAVKPEIRKPGDVIMDAQGRTVTVPDVLGERRVAAEEARVRQSAEEEQRKAAKDLREATAQKAKDKAAYDLVTASADRSLQAINDLIQDPGLNAITGMSAYTNPIAIKGSDAYRALSKLKSITSQLVNDTLQSVRQASANGASGYGQFTEKELDIIKTYVTDLDPGRPDFVDALRQVSQYIQGIKTRSTAMYEQTTSGQALDNLPAGAVRINRLSKNGKPAWRLPDGSLVEQE